MSATSPLADFLKAVQTATSLSGLSTLLVDSLGELVRTGAILIQTKTQTNLDLNDVRDWRICVIDSLSGNMQNAPVKASGMVLVSLSSYHIVLRGGEGGVIYFRAYNNGWQAWKKVSMTVM